MERFNLESIKVKGVKVVITFILAIPLSGYAACTFFDKKLSFADGSSVCLNEYSLFTRKGLMSSIPDESYLTQSRKFPTYAIAFNAQPLQCPFEQSMQWNWGGLEDGKKAINTCEEKMAEAIKRLGKSDDASRCNCELIVDNGKVNLSRVEFEKKLNLLERQISFGNKAIQVAQEESKAKTDEENKKKDSLEQEAKENQRLKAEVEEAKRKQAELEEELRVSKQQTSQATQTTENNKLPLIALPLSSLPLMANRKALVIGNDSYKSVTKLINAREDARIIASNLTAVGYQVTLKLDLNEKEMKSAFRTFATQVQGGDEVMFFFAGHGVQLGTANYLLPTDIGGESEAQVRDDAIQLQRILDDMSDKKAKFTLAMIDACRDNPFKTAGRAIGGRGLAPTTAVTGQMVVFSAGTGQQALDRLGNNDKNKNGVFTRTFVKEMQKPGLSIDRIIKNVRNEVAELAKSVGHEQVPAIYDQVLGDFYFKK